jgi:hypothetical protein
VSEVEFYNSHEGWERSHVDETPPPDDWRWRVRARNGEIVASGEGYTRKEDAVRGFKAAAMAMLEAVTEFI